MSSLSVIDRLTIGSYNIDSGEKVTLCNDGKES